MARKANVSIEVGFVLKEYRTLLKEMTEILKSKQNNFHYYNCY